MLVFGLFNLRIVGLINLINYSNYVKDKFQNGNLLRLTFDNSTTNRPILSKGIMKFEVEINIVNSNITASQTGQLGVMYVHISKDKNCDEFVKYLLDEKVGVEVL